jgi:hypothetical protein
MGKGESKLLPQREEWTIDLLRDIIMETETSTALESELRIIHETPHHFVAYGERILMMNVQ